MNPKHRLMMVARFHTKVDYFIEARDEQIALAYGEGISVRTLAERTGMSRRGIYDILRRQGLPFTKNYNRKPKT